MHDEAAEASERIGKYQAHLRWLEGEREELGRHRGWIRWIPAGIVLAPAGLIAGVGPALAIALAVVLLTGVAAYLNASRTWYTQREMADVRREIEILRHGDPTRDPERELRWWRIKRSMLDERARRLRALQA